ncbi:spore maturation protein CgeB [Paenibacillus phyllosphaerae]|uniref:Spore maturation protein CgeB n=1 Tax=Paenibacillus phyllosphaerae TaxID=274593 RepID=A0A7W5B4Z1_9BACL|nr:glycosyltransferase [Paenibacillus phyllosphaerae]MBB3114458.1 spore maturation protein CgeB [Paenibacillus phyllosphaerae]
MRVLFLESHPMWIHGLPNGFREAGHHVRISGPVTEKSLLHHLQDFKPQLIISLGWTPEHRRNKRQLVRKYVAGSGIPHVFWATEDPTHHETFSRPYVRTVQPNFVFTICRAKVEAYRKMGIPSAHMDFGYHDSVHRREKSSPQYQSDISMVANGYSKILQKYPQHYRIQSLQHLVRPLVEDWTRIEIYGRQWSQVEPVLGVKVPSDWIHGYLPYTEASKIYSSSKIMIGPQNQLTQVTQRTYEILASGGFLLTSDTPEIRRLFRPGKDLVVSNSAAETRRLVRYYLDHPKEREKIRDHARKAVREHSYKKRAQYMIAQLKKHKIIP